MRPVRPVRLFVVTAAVLAVFNVVRGVGAFGRWNDVAAVVLIGVIAGLAWWGGADRSTLGLEPATYASGLRWGAAAFGLVLVVVVAAALIPATSGFLDDARAQVPFPRLFWELGFGILLATVIPEELAFRGLLLGTGIEAWGTWAGTLASSALFGLWHISPTLGTMSANAALDDVSGPAGRALVVLAAVALTFVAGLVFSWLRLRSRSLLAPMIAHLSTNGVAFTVAWLVQR